MGEPTFVVLVFFVGVLGQMVGMVTMAAGVLYGLRRKP